MESNWAELPGDLLIQIMEKLCIANILSSKLVCRNWQFIISEDAELSLLRPVPSPPWLTITPHQSSRASYYNPTNKKVYLGNKQWRPPATNEAKCVGSCHGWLAWIDRMCVMYLTNPFEHGDELIIKLPSIETLPCILGSSPSPYNGIDFEYFDEDTETTSIKPSYCLFDGLITKVVMSAEPLNKNCVVMVIFNTYSSIIGRIAFCKLGDTSWKTLDGRLESYEDLYYSSNNQCFYALCNDTWSIEVWEFHDSSSSMTSIFVETEKRWINIGASMTTNELERYLCFAYEIYLLELNGEILLLVKYIGRVTEDGQLYDWINSGNDTNDDAESRYKTFCFEVYKLDSEKKQWGLVNCLGDEGEYAAFVGVNNAVAFSVRDFPKLKYNSIYFIRGKYEYEIEKLNVGHQFDLGIFSFQDNIMHQCYYRSEASDNRSQLIWISPNLCLIENGISRESKRNKVFLLTFTILVLDYCFCFLYYILNKN